MTESIYKEYENKYYNPNDNDKKPGDNDNWKSIQKGFHDISEKQLETSAGLTLGKGTEDETSVTAAELEAMKEGRDNTEIIGTMGAAQITTEPGKTYHVIDTNAASNVSGALGRLRERGFKSAVLFAKPLSADLLAYASILCIHVTGESGEYFGPVVNTNVNVRNVILILYSEGTNTITPNFLLYAMGLSKTV